MENCRTTQNINKLFIRCQHQEERCVEHLRGPAISLSCGVHANHLFKATTCSPLFVHHGDLGMGWCCELVEPRGFNMWPFHIHIQLYPTHVPTASPNVLLSTHPDQFDLAPQFFHLHVKTHQLQSRRTKERKHAHFNSPDPSSLTTLLHKYW